MAKSIKYIYSTLLVAIFLFIAFGSGESSSSSSSGPDLEKTQEINNYIKGKWSTSYYDMGTTWYYRFEITHNQVKYWSRFGEWEWKSEPDAVLSYELTDIIRDTYGAKFRSLYIENTTLALRGGGGLTYENGCIRFNSSCLKKGWK
jgi:hypothetical protein